MEQTASIPISHGPWKHLLIIVLIIVVVIFVWCRWWPCPLCLPCLVCPSEPVVEGKIVVEDSHASVWMTLDNEWLTEWVETTGKSLGQVDICGTSEDPAKYAGDCAENYDLTFRHGVMLQLGQVYTDGGLADNFKDVVLTLAEGPSPPPLTDAEYDWLDINPAGMACVIDSISAYSLFKNNLVTMDCDPAVTVDPSHAGCLRDRRLHAAYMPDRGVVTYWSGPSYFTVNAHKTINPPVSDPDGVGYTFDLHDLVNVDVWNKGCFVERHEGVKEIRLRHKAPGRTTLHSTRARSTAVRARRPRELRCDTQKWQR